MNNFKRSGDSKTSLEIGAYYNNKKRWNNEMKEYYDDIEKWAHERNLAYTYAKFDFKTGMMNFYIILFDQESKINLSISLDDLLSKLKDRREDIKNSFKYDANKLTYLNDVWKRNKNSGIKTMRSIYGTKSGKA